MEKGKLIASHIELMSSFHKDFMRLIEMLENEGQDSNDFSRYNEGDPQLKMVEGRHEVESEVEHLHDPYELSEGEVHPAGQMGYSMDAPEAFPASMSFTEGDIDLDAMSYGVYLGLPRHLSVHDTLMPTGLYPIIGGLFR